MRSRLRPWLRLVTGSSLGAALVTACSLLTDLDALEGNDAADGSSIAAPDATASSSSGAPATADAAIDADDSGTAGEGGPLVHPYRAAVLADDPAAYWPLDDDGALVVRDIVGAHPGEVLGPLEFGIPGVVGKAVRFDRDTTRIDVGVAFDFPGKTPFAVEFWAHPALESSFANVAWHKDSDGRYGWASFFRDDGQLLFEQSWPGDGGVGTQRIGFSSARPAARFLHCVVSFDGTDLSMYFDGVRVTTTYTEGNARSGPAANAVHMIWGYHYTGDLDEIAIYEHPLSAARVEAHRAAATP